MAQAVTAGLKARSHVSPSSICSAHSGTLDFHCCYQSTTAPHAYFVHPQSTTSPFVSSYWLEELTNRQEKYFWPRMKTEREVLIFYSYRAWYKNSTYKNHPYMHWNVNARDTQCPICFRHQGVLISVKSVSFELVRKVRHSHSLAHVYFTDWVHSSVYVRFVWEIKGTTVTRTVRATETTY